MVALVGLAGTAVVSVLGAGLDTEFAMPSAGADGVVVDDASAAMYNHWIGTIPWLWTLAGLAGLAIFVAFRRGWRAALDRPGRAGPRRSDRAPGRVAARVHGGR